MQVKSSVGSVIGHSNEFSWSQVLVVSQKCAVVEIESEHGLAVKRGIEILSYLNDRLASVDANASNLIQIVHEIISKGATSVALALPVGNVVYLAAQSAKIFVKRSGRISLLIGDSGSLSGKLQKDDVLILATSCLFKSITAEDIISSLNGSPPQEIAEKITLLLHQKDDSGQGSALIYRVDSFVDDQDVGTDIKTTKNVIPRIPIFTSRNVRRIYYAYKSGGVRAVYRGVKRRAKDRFQAKPNLAKKIISIIIILFFALSVVLGLKKQQSNVTSKEALSAINTAKYALEEGAALVELNPIKSREKLNEAYKLLSPYENSRFGPADKVIYDELYKKVKDNLELALKSYDVKPEIFYDTSLLKPGSTAGSISLYGENLIILDKVSQTIFTLDINAKNARVIAGGNKFNGLTLADITADSAAAFDNSGIYKFPDFKNSDSAPIIKLDPEWGTIFDMSVYGGNYYLLDSGKNRIWKYVSTDEGISSRKEYLNSDVLADFKDATGMSIDGSVWIGTRSGKIFRYTSGKENPFVASSVEPGLGQVLIIYTNEDMENLYVADIQNKRLVVLTKDGVYEAQYTWGENFNPVDFVVSKSAKKAIFVADGELFSFGIK